MSSIPRPEGAPEFKFTEGDSSGGPGTIQQVVKLDPYLVAYTDREGKQQVRIAFRVKGGDTTFIIQERIQGSGVVVPAFQWFHKAFTDKLRVDRLEDVSSEVVGSV